MRNDSPRQQRGLDRVSFLQVDVSPYLPVFMKGSLHWGAQEIGLAMAANSVAVALCQIPAGLLVDKSKRKRTLVALAGLLLAFSCLLFAAVPTLPCVLLGQVCLGAGSAIGAPAVAAISLGLVGKRLLSVRISRNGVCNHSGNLLAALLAGAVGQMYGYRWIFLLGCGFAIACALAAPLIPADSIDHDQARGQSGDEEPVPLRDVLRRPKLLVFLASVVLYHFSNAAMLPTASQSLAQSYPNSDRLTLSGCVIGAQLTMMIAAWWVGLALNRGISTKKVFLAALLVLPLRGLLFALTTSPAAVIGNQLLDGVTNGIFGVVSVVIAAELMQGSGRFNLTGGLIALCVGLGDALSNSSAGFVVQRYGYPTGFLFLTCAGVLALVFYALFMPSTHAAFPPEDDDPTWNDF